MDGLLAKAEVLKKLIKSRSSESTQADLAARKEAEVMAEMDSILESSRLEITATTLSFSARSSGILFPVLINLGALLLLAVLGTFFFLRLNQDEISLVNRNTQLSSAEGLIIEALREASELELSRKENQILSIQGKLKEAEDNRASLIAELGQERSLLEERLKAELDQELEAERQRLLTAGLGSAVISSRMAAFEEQRQNEFQSRLSALHTDFDKQLAERSAQFDSEMEAYHLSLDQARNQQEAIKRTLEQQLTEARRDTQRALSTMDAERSAAMEQLETLGRQQENAKLIEGRILTMYDSVNIYLRQEDYQAALAELDRLEYFLGTPEAQRVASVAERQKTEQFLVSSLRRLIHNERVPDSPQIPDLDPFSSGHPLLDAITNRVEEGNRLYAEGRFEAAKAEYTAALAQIPQLDEGYARLQEMASRQLAQERALLEQQLAVATALYKNNQYLASVEKYRQALDYMERENPRLSLMLNDVIDAGYQIRKASEPPPPPVIIREELSLEEKDLLYRAQVIDSRRWTLREALDRLKTSYAAISEESNRATAQENMVLLLNAKLLIRRALLENGNREVYPGLHETLDTVFEAYGEEQRLAGQAETLEALISITEFLNNSIAGKDYPALNSGKDLRQRQLLLEFLGNLQALFEPAGKPHSAELQ